MSTGVQQETGKIQLWEKLEIVVGDGSSAGRYIARLEDFLKNGLLISAPEFVSGDSLLRNGSRCSVHITRDDAIYQFASTITVSENNGQRYYVLRPPQKLQRVQRRQFVRIELSRKVKFAVLGPKHTPLPETDELHWHETTTVNVSGGGLLINLPVEIAAGDLLLVRPSFFPEEGLPLVVVAVCRRVQKPSKMVQAGIEFIRMEKLPEYFTSETRKRLPESVTYFDQIAQNKLVNWVFHEQVKLRQKGLL